MISRKKFVVICMMMVVILFMFQFSQIIKENGNDYETNEYFNKYLASDIVAWHGIRENNPHDFRGKDYVMFWGEPGTPLMDMVNQWCTYNKRNLLTCDEKMNIPTDIRYLPTMLLIDAQSRDILQHMNQLERLTNYGVTIVFCNLPDFQKVANSRELLQLLGITYARMASTQVEGYRLFDGFLLGGEVVYKAQTREEEKLQDFELDIPWYITGKGTKTYMVGLKEAEKTVEREQYPRLIWRNTHNKSMIYAVNGDFMSSLTGLGILDAFVYDSSDYYLYPIVNGNSVAIVDYPSLSNENSKVMEEIYSRNTNSFLRDIVWPGLLSTTLRNELKLTGYISTKYDYRESVTADEGLLTFYLQQMKEVGAEAGRSLRYMGPMTLAEKAEADQNFYAETGCSYNFSAYYSDSLDNEVKTLIRSETGMEGIHTITSKDRGNRPLLSFYTEYTTALGITHDAASYSYQKDLELRSLNTALAYSNMLIDMHNVLWPEEEDHQWQLFYEAVSSNIDTYYSKLNLFDQTTMSESDYRARAMLNLNYSEHREDDTIYLTIVQTLPEAWFMLRTHGEQIESVQNGDFRMIEKDAYLIHTTDTNVQIHLGISDEVYQYKGPFGFMGK